MQKNQQNNVQYTNNQKASPINQSDSNKNDQNQNKLVPQYQPQNQEVQGQGSNKQTPGSSFAQSSNNNDQSITVQINQMEQDQQQLLNQQAKSNAFKSWSKLQSEQQNMKESESAQQKQQNLESEKMSASTNFSSSDSQKGKVQINRIEQNQIKIVPQYQPQNQETQGNEKHTNTQSTLEIQESENQNDQKKKDEQTLQRKKDVSDADVSFQQSESAQQNMKGSERAQYKLQNLESEKTSASTDNSSSDNQNDQKGKVQINKTVQNQQILLKKKDQSNQFHSIADLSSIQVHENEKQKQQLSQNSKENQDNQWGLFNKEAYHQYVSFPINKSDELKVEEANNAPQKNSNPNQELQKFQSTLCVLLQEMIKLAKQDPTKNIPFNRKELKYPLSLSDKLKKQEKELLEFFEGWISYTERNEDSLLRLSGFKDFETDCLNSFISYVEVQKKEELKELKSLIQDESTLNNWKNIMDKLQINNIQFFVMLCAIKKNEPRNEFAKCYLQWWFEWNQTSVFTKEKYQ